MRLGSPYLPINARTEPLDRVVSSYLFVCDVEFA
jgi:hypothetical protein